MPISENGPPGRPSGLLEMESGALMKPSRTLLSNNKRALITKNWITCNEIHAARKRLM